MNKNRFSEIFRHKAFADGWTEKARGCFSSIFVSKIVLILNCNFSLGLFELSIVKQQIVFAKMSIQDSLWRSADARNVGLQIFYGG